MQPQFITTPAGDELVVLARKDYEDLLARAEDAEEDAADLALYDERKAALAAGLDEALPREVSDAILKGEGRLHAIRKWRKLTQKDLSEMTGLGQGYLSELERGDKKGSPETVAKLVAALHVKAEWLS